MVKDIVAAQPGGDGWRASEEYLGKLHVFEPEEFERNFKTSNGETDIIRGNVWVLTGPGEYDEFPDSIVFGKVLVPSLKKGIGSFVVGRLAQGEPQKGKSPAWLLKEATEKDLAKAREFLAGLQVKSAKPAKDEDDDPFGESDDSEDEAY